MKTKKFNAFDKVIWRDKSDDLWDCDLYSYYNEERKTHVTFNHVLKDTQILPYEGNEHLVGSDQNPDEELRLEEGERIIPLNDEGDFKRINRLYSSYFHEIRDGYFMVDKCAIRPEGVPFEFCIRFKDIRFNDMEETKKHILCVKNGKVIRYKG